MNSNSYNILNDITDNALAFIINDNGEIGYRYLIDTKAEGYHEVLAGIRFKIPKINTASEN